MPDCGGTSCSCTIEVGPGLIITGSGSLSNPYVVSLAGSIEDSLIVEDTPTMDLSLAGGGSPTDPYRLSGTPKLRVQDLLDVIDPEGAPSEGDSIVFVTTGVETPRFEFRPPPPSPPGSVNVGVGILGTGAVGDPIKLNLVSDAAGSTGGLPVYVDTNGDLRATAPVATAVTWGAIEEKPTTFPTTPADFTGVLPVSKGGTGQTDLASVTVGNSTRVGGIRIFVQSATPSGAAANDLWFWGA